jgi:hypothetical protein
MLSTWHPGGMQKAWLADRPVRKCRCMAAKKLVIAVVAVVLWAVVAVIVMSNFVREPHTSPLNACINNLRRIDGATQQWALDNHKTTNDFPTWADVRPYLSRDGKIPTCPQGGRYTLGGLDKPPTCSFPGHTLPQ